MLLIWALVASVASHANLMILFACLIGGVLVVGSLLPLTVPRHVGVSVEVPEYLFAGQPGTVRVRLCSRRRLRPLPGVTVRCRLEPPLVSPPHWFVDGLKPGQEETYSATVVIRKRGEYYWREPEVASTYPFGFSEYVRVADGVGRRRLIVYPAIGQWNMELFEQQLGSSVSHQTLAPQVVGREQEFRGLRDYREGDSARWIHWPTTARRGELVVREFEVPRDRRVLLLLIPWLPERATRADTVNLELALSVVATALYELARRLGTRIGVVLAGEVAQFHAVGAGEGAPGPVLEALALMNGTPRPDLEGAAQLLRRWAGPGVFTTVVATAAEERIRAAAADVAVPWGRGLYIDVSQRAQLLSLYTPPPWLFDYGRMQDGVTAS